MMVAIIVFEITPADMIANCVCSPLGMVTAIINATNTRPAAIGTNQPVIPELRIVV